MKFLSFLTAFTGRNTPWCLPFNLLLTTLAKSQSSKNNFIWRFLLPSCRRCFKENFLRERLRYVFIICQFYFSNLFILLGKSVIKHGKKTWLNRYIYSAKKACAVTQMFCNYATNCEVSRSRKFQTSFSKTHKNRYSLQPCLRWIPFGQQLSCGEDKTWTWSPWTGCKENYFYSLPFGQAEASIY